MNPVDVFNAVKNVTGERPVTLCDLHKRCKHMRCDKNSKISQLDFDNIKKQWCKKNRIPTCSSVDGLTYTADTLYMVEIKGTIDFVLHQELSESKIAEQMQRYDLQKKCLNSIELCETIAGVDQLCLAMKIVFLLVTDVDPVKDAIIAFTQQLNMLATTSTDWEKVYLDSLSNHMSNQMTGLVNIKSHFVFCKQFDDYIQ